MLKKNPFFIKGDFVPGIHGSKNPSSDSLWFLFRKGQLLVKEKSAPVLLPNYLDLGMITEEPLQSDYLGKLEGKDCYTAEFPKETSAPSGMAYFPLRELFGVLSEDTFALAGRATQIVDWDRTNRYCGQCGSQMGYSKIERAKICPQCGLTVYPRLNPAIIVRIERGDQILLAHSPKFKTGFYSVIAGFVEAGESLEETVVREIHEEVGISVKDIQYFGSQPWPFPNSLMLAFTAKHDHGEIQIDNHEILDAGWFSADKLPFLPSGISIARKMIDDFVRKVNE